MNTHWQKFLLQQGSRFDDERVTGFGDKAEPTPPSAPFLADLSHEGLISVSGVDARTFLQGQLSTDIDELTPARSQLSSWSNAKGRVVTLFRLLERSGTLYLALPRSLQATVQKKLGMYVLRSKVILADASDGLVHFGLAGVRGAECLERAGIPAPAEINGVTEQAGVQIVRLHGATPRFAVFGDAEALAGIWEKLRQAGATPAGEHSWSLAKILAGEPTIYPETSEHFVAQMIGLEELGAINFKKGCYIGQEIIARAHFRGAVKRHLARAESRNTTPLRPGTDIHTPGDNSPVAEVVDAQLDENGVWRMLLVAHDDYRNAPLVHSASGAAVTFL